MSKQKQHQSAASTAVDTVNQSPAMVDALAGEDRAWELFVSGHNIAQISHLMSCPLPWVQLTINRLLGQHEACGEPFVRGHLAKLLDEVNLIRQAAWSGWRRSLEDKVRIVEKTRESGGRGGNEQTTTTETRSGDPAPLRILIECSKRDSTLRGIERPTTVSVQRMSPPLDLDTLIQQIETLQAGDSRRQNTAKVPPAPNSTQENRT